MSNPACSVAITTTYLNGGQQASFPYSSPNNAAPAPPSSMLLAAGHNPVTVPVSPFTVNGVQILSQSGNTTNVKTLKGANADTGVPMAPGSSAAIGVTTNFVIDSVGAETIQLIWY
jgi:hypothetical protein